MIEVLLLLSAQSSPGLGGRPTEAEWLHRLPVGRSIATTLEQVVPEVILGVEESGGFADPDALYPSILGDSWSWASFYLEGHDITDPLGSGRAAFTTPFSSLGSLRLGFDADPFFHRQGGVALDLADKIVPSAGAQLGTGQVGDLAPGAEAITRAFSASHPRQRARPPPEARRRSSGKLTLWATDEAPTQDGHVEYGLEATTGERRFLDLAPGTGDYRGDLEEGYGIATGWLRYRPKSGAFSALVIAEARAKSQLGAEVGYGALETAKERRLTLFVGVTGGDTKLGLTMTHESTRQRADFPKDLLDPDGAALRPFAPDGERVGLNFDVQRKIGIAYVSVGHRAMAISPADTEVTHPLTIGGAPYGRWDYEYQPHAQLTGNHRFGVAETVDLTEMLFSYDVYASLGYGLQESGGNHLLMPDVGAEIMGRYVDLGYVEPFVLLAKTPVPITPEVVRTLDGGALGVLRLASGYAYDTIGRGYVDIDEGLLPQSVYSAALGLDFKDLGPFRFRAQGLFKAYQGAWRFAYASPSTRTVDGVAFLLPGAKRYRLENADDVPLYFGLHLDLEVSRPNRYLFRVGFLVYNTIGKTPFGIGPLANDLGVVDPSSANPNADSLAAVDGDRAFVTKVAFAYRIISRLWATGTIRHRDGQPFAFYDLVRDGEQVAFTYHSKRGSPLQYQRPLAGPREDFQINIDLGLEWTWNINQYLFKSTFVCANLFDLGNEIAEVQSQVGKDARASLEAQLPRTFLLGLELLP